MRRLLPAGATVVGIAVAMRVLYDAWYLNYDARYALLWARDAWTGHTPEFLADFAPTPHPLQIALSSLALPFGNDAAGQIALFAVLLCFGALVYLTYALGARLFAPWVGVVAAVVVATRPAIERDAVLAYQDIPFAALVLAAVLLEAGRPRRGVPVLVVLALAGLLRPEAWVLAGLYVVWLWWGGARGRPLVVFALLAAIGPVVWALMDLIVTGDALHSLHGTSALAEAADRRRGLGQVPRWGAEYLGFTLREPVLLGMVVGLVFAWLHARRRSVLPFVVVGAMLAVFAIGPIFGLPLIGRYVRTPAVLLTLFFALAVVGWTLLARDHPQRKVWMALGAVVAVVFVAFLPRNVSMLRDLDERTDRNGELYADLRSVARAPAVRQAFERCAPLTSADHRPIPYLRWWLEGDPGTVGTIANGESQLGRLHLVPRRTFYARRFYKENLPTVPPPPGYRTLYENRTWRVLAAPDCR